MEFLKKMESNKILKKTNINSLKSTIEKDIDNLNDFDLFTAFLFTPSKPSQCGKYLTLIRPVFSLEVYTCIGLYSK